MMLLGSPALGSVLPSAAPIILIGIGAFTLPLIAGRLKLPAVVLELIFGLIIGPVLLIVETGTPDAEFVELLAELGLLLLMFLAGFEIDFERLERQGSGPLLTGAALFGMFLVAGWMLLTSLTSYDRKQLVTIQENIKELEGKEKDNRKFLKFVD